ncbi:hypothetical protein [Streptococcus phocae]|uniref:hypothetical protein n=1 Tax=Streptococcus phocae TaxID=119224 RepID=UPI0013793A4E|nr:hypothetical protein [Streptococcus phocae]
MKLVVFHDISYIGFHFLRYVGIDLYDSFGISMPHTVHNTRDVKQEKTAQLTF